ncbi:MAG: hypothetical protein GWO20_10375 [Candidatus Korarchaeota archaeon]|nr:hypothetical protein [Candidatus Korarchaeota archaeon]NIU83900.1 hypothetical protein [Candidatus Thorarchaeota archaeon]NIW14043.1 hypothetical protein [Candidatus Thorarchaeota archaeon]NIW51732.1 hypothetical protein [Candidatus Korarchaeota archaeon]
MSKDIRQLGASEVALRLISKLRDAKKEKRANICRTFLTRYPELLLIQNLGSLILNRIERHEGFTPFLQRFEKKIIIRKQEIAKNASDIFHNDTVLTLSRSSTVLEAFAHSSERIREVIVLESRPAFEGRSMARSIAEMRIEVKIIVDSAVGYFIDKVDSVVIGADAILPEGAVVNKIGSYPLALLSNRTNTPFFVLSSLFKADIQQIGVKVEQRDPKEIWKDAPNNITPLNIYFERVPFSLVSGIYCELGEISPSKFVDTAVQYIKEQEP